MEKWTIDGYKAEYILDKEAITTGETKLDAKASSYFGLEEGSDDLRLGFYYEGREFPSFAEIGSGGAKLSWSKALSTKLIGVFPNYEEFYDSNPSDNERPKLLFDRQDSDSFLVRLELPWNAEVALKQDFFDYIGVGDSAGRMKDAYEMRFLRDLFDNLDNRGFSDVFMVSGKLKMYFEQRYKETGELDPLADKQIEDVQHAGLDTVLAFLMEGPYARAAANDFVLVQQVDDHFLFRLSQGLLDELSSDDKNYIIKSLDKKLEAYYDRMDAPSLQESFTAFMADYASYYAKDFRYSFKDVITEAIPAGLKNTGLINEERYRITGFAGKTDWAEVPYVAIADQNASRLPNTGLYVSYVLNKDKQTLYLALILGYAKTENELRRENPEDLREAVARTLTGEAVKLRTAMSWGTFSKNTEDVELPDERIAAGIVCYKAYAYNAPQEATLRDDLGEIMDLYREALQIDIEAIPEAPGLQAEELETPETQESLPDAQISEVDENETSLPVASEEQAPEEDAPVSSQSVILLGTDEAAEPIQPQAQPEAPAQYEVQETEAKGHTDKEQAPTTEAAQTSFEDRTEAVIAEVQARQMPQSPVYTAVEPIQAAVRAETLVQEAPLTRPARRSEARIKTTRPESIVSRQAVGTVYDVVKESVRPGRSLAVRNYAAGTQSFTEPENVRDAIEHITAAIAAHGYNPSGHLVEDTYLSLKAYPVTAFTGKAGSGTDVFARLYAAALGATQENGRYEQLRIGREPIGSAELFGAGAEGFTEGRLTEFIRRAVQEPDAPFFVFLRDVRLSEENDLVGELLCIYDNRFKQGDEIVTPPILTARNFTADSAARARYEGLYLPDNLFIMLELDAETSNEALGTLGHMNVITVNTPNLKLAENTDVAPVQYGSRFLRGELLELSENKNEKDMIQDVIVLLEAINGILVRAGAQIGYHERDEICLFLLYNAQEGLISQDEALDLAVLQKIIPRIYGSGERVETVLTDLFKICAGTRADDAVRSYPGSGGLFPNSAGKLSEMVLEYDAAGTTSIFK